MSSISAPFGFRPSYHNSGQMRPKAYTIASAYAANIFQGDPVKLVDNGTVQLGTSDGTRTGTRRSHTARHLCWLPIPGCFGQANHLPILAYRRDWHRDYCLGL